MPAEKKLKPTGAVWRLSFLGRPWITVKSAPGRFVIDFADDGAKVLGGVAQQAVQRISAHLQANKRKDPVKIFEELKFILDRLGGIIDVEIIGGWDGKLDEDKPDAIH